MYLNPNLLKLWLEFLLNYSNDTKKYYQETFKTNGTCQEYLIKRWSYKYPAFPIFWNKKELNRDDIETIYEEIKLLDKKILRKIGLKNVIPWVFKIYFLNIHELYTIYQ